MGPYVYRNKKSFPFYFLFCTLRFRAKENPYRQYIANGAGKPAQVRRLTLKTEGVLKNFRDSAGRGDPPRSPAEPRDALPNPNRRRTGGLLWVPLLSMSSCAGYPKIIVLTFYLTYANLNYQ
jgi:hypothetical protein